MEEGDLLENSERGAAKLFSRLLAADGESVVDE